jgi:hypothetical protein
MNDDREKWRADVGNGRRTIVPRPPAPVPRPTTPDDDNYNRPEDLVNSRRLGAIE